MAASLGGLVLGIASVRFQVQSERALSRAVWEYNRVLPTDADLQPEQTRAGSTGRP